MKRKDAIYAATPQPAPTGGYGDVLRTLGDDTSLPGSVRAVLSHRRDFGMVQYGTPLRFGTTSRDPWVDLAQEQMDALAYAKQALESVTTDRERVHAERCLRVTALLLEETLELIRYPE